MTKVFTVTYLGKAGKPDTEELPWPGIHPPFRVGVPEKFDEQRLRSMGVDPEKAADFITGPEGFVTLANANRAEGTELFKVTSTDPATDNVVKELRQTQKTRAKAKATTSLPAATASTEAKDTTAKPSAKK